MTVAQQQADRTTQRATDQDTDAFTDPSAPPAAMRVLVVGGAGHVGGILRPALEAVHSVSYMDIHPVADTQQHTFIGSVTDEAAVREAVTDIDAVVYLAMGVDKGENIPPPTGDGKPDPVQRNFDVNVQGVYRVMHRALDMGVRRFVYASTLSVYGRSLRPDRINESHEPTAWHPYGLTKRLGEHVCTMGGMNYPDATIVGLRLVHPLNEQQHAERQERLAELAADPSAGAASPRGHDAPQGDPTRAGRRRRRPFGLWLHGGLAPGDLRRLFLAALAMEKPGAHIVQATGDLTGKYCPNDAAHALLGWRPHGE